ncbi:MAG: non-homologous end-joining DNA ligase [Vulcanimicrobiaceae bacterium]
MLATLIDEPFDDADWLFEIKWDGYRALCEIREDGSITLTSRNGLDFLPQFPELEDLGDAFSGGRMLIDGEIVSLDDRGRSSFQRLQGSFNRHRPSSRGAASQGFPLTFVAFDCLYANGRDLRNLPLEERKDILQDCISEPKRVLFSKHILERGCALFEQAQARQLEGIIGKKRDSLYVERRSRDWVKIKAQLIAECVIGGYTEPRGSRKGFGSLLLGLYEGKKLHFVGNAGTGFDAKKLASMTKQMQALETDGSPFAEPVKANTPAHFIEPKLVAQIRFTEWTRDGVMRHPAFLGLRADKKPSECVREKVVDTDELV